jgi:hypothetical protein
MITWHWNFFIYFFNYFAKLFLTIIRPTAVCGLTVMAHGGCSIPTTAGSRLATAMAHDV